MKQITFLLATIAIIVLTSCEEEKATKNITLGDYPVKEYYFERSPNVNPWGVGMDLIHQECNLTDTELDYLYRSEDSTNIYDLLFYTVKVYFTDDKGDTKAEGCPAILLGDNVTACQVGKGIAYFDSLTIVTKEMTVSLVSEPEINFENCKNSAGKYDRDLIFKAYEPCVIGQRFRSDILIVPQNKTEEQEQPVFLIKTSEGGYVKFMVKQFKGDAPHEKQSLMHWQVISE